jgi:hypothetical protein
MMELQTLSGGGSPTSTGPLQAARGIAKTAAMTKDRADFIMICIIFNPAFFSWKRYLPAQAGRFFLYVPYPDHILHPLK